MELDLQGNVLRDPLRSLYLKACVNFSIVKNRIIAFNLLLLNFYFTFLAFVDASIFDVLRLRVRLILALRIWLRWLDQRSALRFHDGKTSRFSRPILSLQLWD